MAHAAADLAPYLADTRRDPAGSVAEVLQLSFYGADGRVAEVLRRIRTPDAEMLADRQLAQGRLTRLWVVEDAHLVNGRTRAGVEFRPCQEVDELAGGVMVGVGEADGRDVRRSGFRTFAGQQRTSAFRPNAAYRVRP